MNSLWQSERLPQFTPLQGDVQTDVLIIGGGMAGILCAYLLGQAGADYLLVEAQTLCSGITKNTTAKLTAQHGLLYKKLLRILGTEQAKLYLQINQTALRRYAELCSGIDCDYEKMDSYVYSLDNRQKLQAEVSSLRRLGADAVFVPDLPLPMPTVGAVRLAQQAQFHPLKFISAITTGMSIREHTEVRELIGTTAVTAHGKIHAKRIIVATHFPFINKHGSYFLKLYQHRSYCIALKNALPLDGMYVDASQKGLSFRSYGELLLLGGGAHRTGKQGGGWSELRAFAKTHYPNAAEQAHWATQDCMTLDGVPYIGRYSATTADLYVATGFNKWGMSSAMVSAMLLTELLQGKRSPYAEIFSPSRSILKPQLAVNAAEAVVNLLTPTRRRCPHLGCALKWNKQEHTWDCPCHGSRFTANGNLIDNPATGDLRTDPS